MHRERLTSRQIFYLITTLVVGLHVAQPPRLLVHSAQQDLWLAMLAAVGADLAIAVVLHQLALRFPRQTVFTYSRRLLGRVVGTAVALLLVWFFIHVAALAVRQVADFFLMIMPETPLTVFVTALTALCSLGAYLGWGAIGRCAELAGPLILAIAAALVGASLTVADVGNLRPILPFGPGRALAAAPLPAAWLGVCLVIAVFAAGLEDPHKTFWLKARAMLTGVFLTTCLALESVASLGQNFAGEKVHPVLFMMRLLRFGQFFERTELLFYLFGTAATVLIVTALQHAALIGLSECLGGIDHRPLAAPLGVLIAALALGLVQSRLHYETFMADAFPPYALSIEAGVPVLLLLIALLRRRRPAQ